MCPSIIKCLRTRSIFGTVFPESQQVTHSNVKNMVNPKKPEEATWRGKRANKKQRHINLLLTTSCSCWSVCLAELRARERALVLNMSLCRWFVSVSKRVNRTYHLRYGTSFSWTWGSVVVWARLQLPYHCRGQVDAPVGNPRRWLQCARGVHVLLMLQPLFFIVDAFFASVLWEWIYLCFCFKFLLRDFTDCQSVREIKSKGSSLS